MLTNDELVARVIASITARFGGKGFKMQGSEKDVLEGFLKAFRQKTLD